MTFDPFNRPETLPVVVQTLGGEGLHAANAPLMANQKAELKGLVEQAGAVLHGASRINREFVLKEKDGGLLFNEQQHNPNGSSQVKAATYCEPQEGTTLSELTIYTLTNVRTGIDADQAMFENERLNAKLSADLAERGVTGEFANALRGKFIRTLMEGLDVQNTRETEQCVLVITESVNPKQAAAYRALQRTNGHKKINRDEMINACPKRDLFVRLEIEGKDSTVDRYSFTVSSPNQGVVIKGRKLEVDAETDNNHFEISRKPNAADAAVAKALINQALEWFKLRAERFMAE